MDKTTTTLDPKSLLGKGVYTIADAARFIDADPRSVRRWVLGYNRISQVVSPPILVSNVAVVEGVEFLTFTQLIEAMFIRLFRKHGISMPVIRAAASNAASLFDTEYPFAWEGLQTDGSNIFHLNPSDIEKDGETITREQIVQDLARGQTVIGDFAKPYFIRIDYIQCSASTYWPLGKDRNIAIDRERNFGQPIDTTTGVPTNIIFGMYNSGDSLDVIMRSYNMKKSAVIDAIEFEQSLLRKAA